MQWYLFASENSLLAQYVKNLRMVTIEAIAVKYNGSTVKLSILESSINLTDKERVYLSTLRNSVGKIKTVSYNKLVEARRKYRVKKLIEQGKDERFLCDHFSLGLAGVSGIISSNENLIEYEF